MLEMLTVELPLLPVNVAVTTGAWARPFSVSRMEVMATAATSSLLRRLDTLR